MESVKLCKNGLVSPDSRGVDDDESVGAANTRPGSKAGAVGGKFL